MGKLEVCIYFLYKSTWYIIYTQSCYYVKGTVYGYGQLAKDIVTEKDAPQPSTGEAWGNAGKAFVSGYLGGFVGNKATNAASKYFTKISGNGKTAIDALTGSVTSTLYSTGLNKITEEQKKK